ncbi:D-3-phosphoglycerate dehydrogenase [Enterococcus sp. PF1-24]|uniref:phosphoglycerate dehydrogenase n=1 Tax=unclassified Enterococcus TaxID=2608891 RepID=UPI002476D7E2|nr:MULTISPECIES: phosphoglycerate dehydrogenase [unclassified Enterococcus]MDH6364852.1 D-3-phosphoglycerate dehydrogenase [Enterococcus sp. PFB1-1]MDH6401924.1 D-3-phosphoglycerate dehydrogenase [Enterococcus sp. PF1-24]
MFDIKTFNAIAPEGLARFDQENFTIDQTETPAGIVLRSQKLHDYAFPETVLGVARAGAGTNNVPVKACAEKGIVVFNTPGANANAVKELVLASLLVSVRPLIQGASWVQTLTGANVEEQVEGNKKAFAGSELEGKRLGVIGLGAIGAMVANDAYRLGMEVTGYDPFVSVDTAWSISRRVKRANNLDEIFANCDFITIHVPLTEETKHMISTPQLQKMKETAILLNFSRGELVDSAAILTALAQGEIAGYVTDFAEESLLHQEKVLVLPHLGASTEEAEVNCAKMAARTLKNFLLTGEIKRSVNFPTVEMAFQSPYRFTIIHKNVPNMLSQISSEIADLGINIDTMINKSRDEYAYTLVDVAETSPEKIQEVAAKIQTGEHIIRVRTIQNTGGAC